MIIEETTYMNIHGFEENELQRMRDYLLGAVQAWCRDRHGEWFAARVLLGGANFFWQGTPLIRLFDFYMAVFCKTSRKGSWAFAETCFD